MKLRGSQLNNESRFAVVHDYPSGGWIIVERVRRSFLWFWSWIDWVNVVFLAGTDQKVEMVFRSRQEALAEFERLVATGKIDSRQTIL